MSGFVSKGREAVTLAAVNPETGEMETNTIWIRSKMGWGGRQRVKGVIFDNVRQDLDGKVEADVNFGRASVQLLKENILDWSGPAFMNERGKKVPVSSGAIDDLDPEWELVDMVLERINELNRAKSDDEEAQEIKNLPTGGSLPTTEDTPDQLEPMTSRSFS